MDNLGWMDVIFKQLKCDILLQLPRQHEVSGDVQAGVRLQEDEVQLHRCGLAQQRQEM